MNCLYLNPQPSFSCFFPLSQRGRGESEQTSVWCLADIWVKAQQCDRTKKCSDVKQDNNILRETTDTLHIQISYYNTTNTAKYLLIKI